MQPVELSKTDIGDQQRELISIEQMTSRVVERRRGDHGVVEGAERLRRRRKLDDIGVDDQRDSAHGLGIHCCGFHAILY